MLKQEEVADIAKMANIEIKESRPGILIGRIIGDDGKKYGFNMIYAGAYADLRLKVDNQEIVKILGKKIGSPNLRAEKRNLIGKVIYYIWNSSPEDSDNLFWSITAAVGQCRRFGWQKITRY